MSTPTPDPSSNGWRVPGDARPPVSAPVFGAPFPAGGAGPIVPDGLEAPSSSRSGELLLALGVAAVITVLGFPLGWLWSAVAPWTPVQMTSDGAVLSQPEQEQMIADEGWYLLITVVTGLLVGVLAWAFLRRYRGAFMLLGLAVGGVLGGVLTFKFGHHIGYAHFRNLVDNAPVGANFGAPVNLRIKQVGLWHWLPYARGDVLALAIAATVIYLLLAGFSSYSSLRGPDPAEATAPAAPGLPLNGYPATQPYPDGQSYPVGQPYPGGQSYPGGGQSYPDGVQPYPGGVQPNPGTPPYPGGQPQPGGSPDQAAQSRPDAAPRPDAEGGSGPAGSPPLSSDS